MQNLSQYPNPSQTGEVKSFSWIEIDIKQNPPTLNYVKSFLQQNEDGKVNYKALDIPKADPFQAGTGGSFAFDISSLQNRLGKWGSLTMPKGSKEDYDYDLDDSFIDDDEKINNQKGPSVGIYESVWDDFVCQKGGLEAFRNSEYYQERIASLKAGLKEEKTKKKKTIKKKDEVGENKDKPLESQQEKKQKKKRTDQALMINKRESQEVKKVKKESDPATNPILENLGKETKDQDTS